MVSAGFTNCLRRTLMVLEGKIGDRIISRDLWPAHSPDVTPRNLNLWEELKDEVYRMNTHTEEELKENIGREFS
jgi:hypothetical protein